MLVEVIGRSDQKSPKNECNSCPPSDFQRKFWYFEGGNYYTYQGIQERTFYRDTNFRKTPEKWEVFLMRKNAKISLFRLELFFRGLLEFSKLNCMCRDASQKIRSD